jgi:hypothetical protein
MKLKNRQILAHGRLSEARQAENAMLATISSFKDDWSVKLFKSREAMRHFCKDGGKMHALIKDQVPANLLVNRNMQKKVKA